MTKEKSFITLTPGDNVLKTFFLCRWRSGLISKRVCSWPSLSSLVYHLLVTPGAYPRRKHLKGTPIGPALALPSNSKTWLERVFKDKPSSLLGLIIGDKGKMFYNIDTWWWRFKNFFPLSLMMRPDKLECLFLAITFQSSLSFVGNTRSLPKKEASERHSNWAGSGLALRF